MHSNHYYLIRSFVRALFGMVLIGAVWFMLHWLASNIWLAFAGAVGMLVLYALIVHHQSITPDDVD